MSRHITTEESDLATRRRAAADAALTDGRGGILHPDQAPRPGLRVRGGGGETAAATNPVPNPCVAEGLEPGSRGTGA